MTEAHHPGAAGLLPHAVAQAAARDIRHGAARLLCALVLVCAVGLALAAWWAGPPGPGVAGVRAAAAAGLVLVAGAGLVLARRGQPGAAVTLALAALVVAVGAQAWASGLGLHSLGLAGVTMLVALAGALVSLRAALAVAGVQAALLALLWWGEHAGHIAGGRLAATLGAQRWAGQLLMLGCAMAAAALLARGVARTLAGAAQQEQRLHALLRIGSDWDWETDHHGQLTRLSPSFEPRTGRTVAEFLRIGQPGGPRLADAEQTDAMRRALAERVPFHEVLSTYECADGTLLEVRLSGEPVRNAAGQVVGWWGVGRNVTRERQAERERQRSQAMLDRLVQLSPDAICVARVDDGGILMCNPGFERFSGWPREELLGRSALQLGLWRDRAEQDRLEQALKTRGVARDLRSTVYDRSGEPRQVLITAAAFDWGGQPVAVITTRDITESERARQETEAILDNTELGIALVRGRHFQRVNPAFERMFGRAPGSLAGQPTVVMFEDPQRHAEFAALSDAANAGGGVFDVERWARRPDGSRLLVRLRSRAVDPQRVVQAGCIWVAEDITALRQGQQALAEAKQQAEAASRAKSDFLAHMSHEIRTPLNGVLGLAQLLGEPDLPAARRAELLGLLMQAASALGNIVSDVLDLSKIEASQLQLEQVPFDPAELACAVFGPHRVLGEARGLTMHCEVAPGLPPLLLGDPLRVRQILDNYLGNAVKFTAAGQVRLRVQPRAGGGLRAEVHDSGPGITLEMQARLFTPFAQGDSSTTRRYGGTGLGLAICRELAQRMGGDVGVVSRPGQGACFWLELPLPTATDMAGPAPRPAGQPLAGLCVLVAEDNPVNMLITTELLLRMGAQVHQAHDGEQAVRLATERHDTLHLVLMDLHMPGMDGLQATRALREQEATRGLPVLALSAAALDSERHQALAAGMQGFVPKPVQKDALMHALLPYVPG